jgi:hypothetical protein
MEINDQDILVSYDVSSRFTNVPVDETIEALAEKHLRMIGSTKNMVSTSRKRT